MKYFIQFEGREKLLLKVVFVLQLVMIVSIFWLCARPNYLYIDNEQSKEIAVWLANELNSEELLQTEKVKAVELLDYEKSEKRNLDE